MLLVVVTITISHCIVTTITRCNLHCRYIVTGFIDKNKDPIYQDFMRLLYNRSALSVCHMIVT